MSLELRPSDSFKYMVSLNIVTGYLTSKSFWNNFGNTYTSNKNTPDNLDHSLELVQRECCR